MKTTTRYITLALIALLVIYLLLLDTLAKPVFEQQASAQYGAEVSIDSLSLSPFVGKVTLYNLQVADRSNPMRNLAQADRVFVDISMPALVEDIIDVRQLEVEGLLVFAPRQEPAEILRPLVEDDSDIALAVLPNFRIPDGDTLLERQREKLDRETQALQDLFQGKEEKWRERMATLPGAADIDALRQRVSALQQGGDNAANADEARRLRAQINEVIANAQSLQQEFRGDIELMREQIALADELPRKHTRELMASFGLTSGQTAQLGSLILSGDLDGILPQVLAPLAFSTSAQPSPVEGMPIFVDAASISGQLLQAAPGLEVTAEISDFAWPLDQARGLSTLSLRGGDNQGGTISVDASVDHRGLAQDRVSVTIDRLLLRDMRMQGVTGLDVTLQQALASVEGELTVQGEELAGKFHQQYDNALFDTRLQPDAGQAARLVVAVLEESTGIAMDLELSGTVGSPLIDFDSDLDQVIAATLEQAIGAHVGEIITELQNRISSEIGPEIAGAREQFAKLEALQAELRASLDAMAGS